MRPQWVVDYALGTPALLAGGILHASGRADHWLLDRISTRHKALCRELPLDEWAHPPTLA